MSRRQITIRPAFLTLAKGLVFGISAVAGAPLQITPWDHHHDGDEDAGLPLWILYVVSMVLVLLGGAFAGLTIALMGQDSIFLQVTSRDPEEPQRKNAKRVHDLINRGKHWVLVTLLLSNVIVNETLPVVLDRCFGGGVAAVVGSTVLIVIFGEILPQSICVRYGLQIGGFMSKPVLLLMYLMAPIAWPTAKLLDWLLGEDHGTVYKKSGLKTLVTLHQSLGEVSERLNEDEVTIISAVLDLKRKPVEEVMTPMEDVYVMSEDTVLDEKTIDQILVAGYSRIPIHQTGNPNNYVGMLLVKILITYDPEDCKRVRDFSLATLPETRPETSCLDIINFFQEGKSHMVLISEFPGEDHGTLGVVTLEDVIEELIGEEIIDESDVYVDVHKAIRRSHPAPKARVQQQQRAVKDLIDLDDTENGQLPQSNRPIPINGKTDIPSQMASSPRTTTLLMRRSSTGQDGQMVHTTVPLKANYEEIRGHLKHLGPSNPASNPKSTKVAAVKIKPGTAPPPRSSSVATDIATDMPGAHDGIDERTSLLRPHMDGKDGIQALHQSYNTSPLSTNVLPESVQPKLALPTDGEERDTQTKSSVGPAENNVPIVGSTSSVGSLQSHPSNSALAAERRQTKRGYVRSGSITENVIEAGGVRKVVLEATSSGDEGEASGARAELVISAHVSEDEPADAGDSTQADGTSTASGQGPKKKNRRKKRKGSK